MALATGADTEKMRWGHRGGNHPVKDLKSSKSLHFFSEPRICDQGSKQLIQILQKFPLLM